MKKYILRHTPVFFQNLLISVYNTYLYRQRHSNNFDSLKNYYSTLDLLPSNIVLKETKKIEIAFLEYITIHSKWYSQYAGKPLSQYPLLSKKDLINNLDDIVTVSEKEGLVSYTGGTTGASLKVIYTLEDVSERQAILESFRGKYGHTLGEKTAWFSGKDIVTKENIRKGICFRDDWINRIRFFSTFHVSYTNFDIYWKAFVSFSPKFIVGFPSSLYEICIIAYEKNINFRGVVKVFFPTAEAMTKKQKNIIFSVLGCQIIDQYASSEGAPFILQCDKGSLHMNPYTGVFEVLDQYGISAEEGDLVVTAFHTHGTPLVRYKIGDRVKLAATNFSCECGSSFQVVEEILGRSNDFIWSKERGRVNLGNISNCTKNVKGVICFQVIQNSTQVIDIKIVANIFFTTHEKKKFIANIKRIIGSKIHINISLVKDLSKEKSGKFSLIKNTLISTDYV